MKNASLIGEKALKLAVEILKTGRRMRTIVRLDPKGDTINVDEFMKIKDSSVSLADRFTRIRKPKRYGRDNKYYIAKTPNLKYGTDSFYQEPVFSDFFRRDMSGEYSQGFVKQ